MLSCRTVAAAVCVQQHEQEVQAAKAQLEATDASVTELRGQLAALNSDFKGQLAAKDVQVAELQASTAKLNEQLADAEAAKRQAEEHAGVWEGHNKGAPWGWRSWRGLEVQEVVARVCCHAPGQPRRPH